MTIDQLLKFAVDELIKARNTKSAGDLGEPSDDPNAQRPKAAYGRGSNIVGRMKAIERDQQGASPDRTDHARDRTLFTLRAARGCLSRRTRPFVAFGKP